MAGNTYMVAGERMNALACAYKAPTPSSVDSKFPITNLYGLPGKAFSFSDLTGTISGDNNEIANGTMEDAFVGELPTSAWVKIAGGVITRDTGTVFDGTASLKLNPAAAGDGLYYDLLVRPGERWSFSGAAYGGASSTVASVRVRNLDTGSWLDGATGLWLPGSLTYLCNATTNAWARRIIATNVETWALCGNIPLTRLRFYIECTADGGDDVFFDEICAWRSLNFVSMHGHNVTKFCSPIDICLGSSPNPVVATTTLPYVEGVTYSAFNTNDSRYWRWRVANSPIGEPLWIDKLIMGQRQQLFRRQKWEQEIATLIPQDRSERGDLGPAASYLRGSQRLQVRFNFRHTSDVEFSLMRRIMMDSANGAHPTVVVVDSDADQALVGRQCALVRMDPRYASTRVPAVTPVRDSSITLDEFAMFRGMMQ